MANVKVTSRLIKDFDPKALEQLRRRIAGERHTVNVGFPANGEQHDDAEMSMAGLAAIHEFGTDTIPERSFLRAGVRRNKGKYVQLNRKVLAKVLKGELSLEQALGLLGEQAKSDVQMEITNGDFTPLSPATIAAKGSTKPLIDSGQLRQSVHWELGE